MQRIYRYSIYTYTYIRTEKIITHNMMLLQFWSGVGPFVGNAGKFSSRYDLIHALPVALTIRAVRFGEQLNWLSMYCVTKYSGLASNGLHASPP